MQGRNRPLNWLESTLGRWIQWGRRSRAFERRWLRWGGAGASVCLPKPETEVSKTPARTRVCKKPMLGVVRVQTIFQLNQWHLQQRMNTETCEPREAYRATGNDSYISHLVLRYQVVFSSVKGREEDTESEFLFRKTCRLPSTGVWSQSACWGCIRQRCGHSLNKDHLNKVSKSAQWGR